MEIISPLLDVMFKRMFSMPDNKEMLCDFLKTFIVFKDGELTDVTLIDKEIHRTPEEKNSILDLRVDTGHAEVDVEVQIQKTTAFNDRIAYYLSKIFSDQLGENDSYSKLHKCVSLCILDFKMFDDDRYFRTMKIQDDLGNILTDKMEFDCLEVPKTHKLEITDSGDKKLYWAKLFAVSSEEELDMVQQQANSPAIDKAVLTIKKLSADEQMKLEAEARLKEFRDRQSMYETGYDNGIEQGLIKGATKREKEIIANMRACGMTEEQIAKIINDK